MGIRRIESDQRLERSKEYHVQGPIKRYCFYLNGAIHGQEMLFDIDGNVIRNNFWIRARQHGDQIGNRYNEDPKEKLFYHYDEKRGVVNIPYLPEKPKRLPSNRTRFQTLEIL